MFNTSAYVPGSGCCNFLPAFLRPSMLQNNLNIAPPCVHARSMVATSRGFCLPILYQEIPSFLKMLVSQQFPAWVKPVFLGLFGAAAASLALVVTQHVSVRIHLH